MQMLYCAVCDNVTNFDLRNTAGPFGVAFGVGIATRFCSRVNPLSAALCHGRDTQNSNKS